MRMQLLIDPVCFCESKYTVGLPPKINTDECGVRFREPVSWRGVLLQML